MEEQQPKRLPWHPLLAVIFVIALYFAASVIAGSILGIALVLMGWNADRISDALTSNSVYIQFTYVVLVELLTVTALVLFLRLYKTTVRAVGLIKPRLKDLAFGALAYPIYFLAFLALATAATHFIPGFNLNQEQELGFENITGALPLLLTFVSLVVLPPIVEELLFRGFLFTSFRARVGFWVATLITSSIFAVAHLPEGGSGGPLYIAAMDTFILSIALCYLREKTGSLWASITLHAIKNGIAYLSLFILATH